MTTVAVCVGDGPATRRHQEHFVQADSMAIAPEQRAERPFTGRHGHEEWMERIDEAWQGHLETLRQYISGVLLKNQQLRASLLAANEIERRHGNGRAL